MTRNGFYLRGIALPVTAIDQLLFAGWSEERALMGGQGLFDEMLLMYGRQVRSVAQYLWMT